MNRAVADLSERASELVRSLEEFERSLAKLVEQETTALAKLEQGKRFDPSRAELQSTLAETLQGCVEPWSEALDRIAEVEESLVDLSERFEG